MDGERTQDKAAKAAGIERKRQEAIAKGIEMMTGPVREEFEKLAAEFQTWQESAAKLFHSAEMQKALKQLNEIMPYSRMVSEAFPNGDPLWTIYPLHIFLFPIRAYIENNDLQDAGADTIEAHRGPFLAFYKAYMDECRAIEKDNPTALNSPRVHKKIMQALACKGLVQAADNEEIRAEALEGFYLLAQSHASNKLSKKLTERMAEPAQFDFYGNGSIAENDFRLFVKGYRELVSGVNETAARLLDSLMITATRNGLQNTLVTLPIREYLDMRGLKDEKEIRRQVKADIDALERISFEYKGTGKNKGAWLKVSISGGTVGQIKNGDIIFRFNQDFFESFKVGAGNRYLYMYFPREALRGNIKENPWKYWLARKISEHKRMNIGKPNEDTISVQTLIDACPNYPTYEKVTREDRAISRRIIEPFERDLDALNPSISWEYQGLNESPRNYQEFINANIVIHWSTYPDTQQIEAGKKKRAKTQRTNKEKTAKKGGVNHSKKGGEPQQKGG